MNETIHDTFLQICKSTNSQNRKFAKLQIRKLATHYPIFKLVNYRILFLILFPLWGLGGYAQNYDWDWAMSGGGMYGSETIYDIKVGSDNNYYFIGDMKAGTPQLDGVPVTIYNNGLGGTDIFLFSTTCEDRKSTRLNSSHVRISYAVFCLKKKKK